MSEQEPEQATELSSEPAIEPRLPRAVQALYLRPLRRECAYGVPCADLQMRSYSVRSLEFFADFALRAAYYLGLPAFGPVPLPRITERWTVPKSPFIHKKSQENFERITMRRLIQIRDGHPETVQTWLAFLHKHAYPGIGMKANVWEYSPLDVGKSMDEAAVDVSKLLEPQWAHLGEGLIKTGEEAGGEAEATAEPDAEAVERIKERLVVERMKAAGGL
ncbi:tryptophanyl-tRNA synthetase [Niveomyces insectorum RCEF 264]|uniref:Small ribosomal subunit protein uS10m n=1 Tax=Niveomyces insectorum RCEF 264 TaxID=1081102 RepID=A0A167NJ28_9HYPO|nr:tryptophanyl-tRNA synthetase [Niveomyces insectorum RCEF 264]